MYHAEHDADPSGEPYRPGFDGSRSIDWAPRKAADAELLKYKYKPAGEQRQLNPALLAILHEEAEIACKRRGWKLTKHRDRFDELVSIGEEKLMEILQRPPEPIQAPIHEALAPSQEPSEAKLRKALKNAFLDQSRRMLAIPRKTRSRWVQQGKEFEDLQQHSIDLLFEDGAVSAKVEDENSHWPRALTARDWSDFHEVLKFYEVLYSLTWDDLDRAILEARWGGGIYIPFDTEQPSMMLHVDDVATVVGVKRKLVQQRLNALEQRYYKYRGLRPRNGRMPKGDRRLTASAAA